MNKNVNNEYREYFEEDITLDDIEIVEVDGKRRYRGIVVKNNHPQHRRCNSLVRTAAFTQIGEIVEIDEAWFM